MVKENGNKGGVFSEIFFLFFQRDRAREREREIERKRRRRVVVARLLVPGVFLLGGGHGELAAAACRSVYARAVAQRSVTREGEREKR